jgi:HEAT repeat protein
VRRFFAGLTDSQTRMAAVDMIDRRYVSVVPQSLHEELLRPLLADDDLKVRARAAKAVAYLGSGVKHAEALIALLEQPDREAQTAALAAMGRSRAERFLPLVQEYLQDDQPELRIAAAWAMIRFPAARAGPLVEPLLEDANAEVRANAVQSLAVMGWAGGVRRIERLLADANPVVRQRAVQFLADHGDARSPQALVEVLDDPHSHVRAHAAEALGRLEATEQAAHVRRMLKDEDVVVRRYAIVAMGRLRDRDSVTRLAERDKPPAPNDYRGAWRMLLPAGFEHEATVEAAGENRYRLAAGGTRFNGIYQVREGRLVAVEPEETRVEGFQWQIRSPYMLTLVEQSEKPEHDYRGTVLFRPRPAVER